MSTGYTIALWVAVTAILALRFLVPGLPLRRRAAVLGGADLAALSVGMVGLVFHCTAMFNRPLVDGIPGLEPVIRQINALGVASAVWYAVPAVLVLIALRRQHWAVLLLVIAAVAAVGITMYNGTSLSVHLGTILALVVVLALVTSALVVVRLGSASVEA